MDKAPGVLINQRVQRSGPAPRLRLLTELEPGYRVFFDNLADLLLSRRVPQIPVTSRPAPFWGDVFVPVGARWSSFLWSMLCHLLLIILFVWGQSRVWVPVKRFAQQDAFHRSVTYYPPGQSFPAVEGRASSVRARSRVKQTLVRQPVRQPAQQPSRQPAIPVTPQQRPSIVTPPDIKQATARLPNFPDSHAVTPMVPFSAAVGPRRNALGGPSEVVAPPPEVDQDVDQATARRLALPQGSAVAPAPELRGPSAGRAMKVPDTGGLGVVPPPPSVQNAGNLARAGRFSSWLSSLSGAGSNVVPPPPSDQGAGNAAGDARPRLGSMAGSGSQVVPPPPTVQGSGGSARAGRLSSLPGAGPNVIPPPPAVQRAGNAVGGTRLSAMAGAGVEVVPPPPSVEGVGNSGAGRRLGSLPGNRSGNGFGNGSGDGSQIVPSPPSVEGTGTSGAGGPAKALDPMEPLPIEAASSTPAVNNENKSTVEELPLGLLGVVFAPPGTSFFSNFEVFVAKRRVGKDELQLIKLVYEFLPYQRRLSEYDLSNSSPRVIKLRVTPDPSCNESLGKMIQSDTDPIRPATEYSKLPAALRSFDLNAVLPCYRTTAGDFQKAMSQAR